MIDDIFAAGEQELREVMMPRTEVSFLDASLSVSKAIRLISDQPHSRYPVIRGSADEVIGHCLGKLAKFKVPASVEFIQALPRNATGKVLKRTLRDEYVATDAPAIS